MGIKTYNPYTPSRRNMTGSDFSEITKTTPEKALTTSLKKNAGRNNQGKITVRHHGGGNRRKYRVIDFKRNSKDGIPAKVVGIEYDPNRTANIALICYADGEKAYILAPAGLTDGMTVMSGATAEVRVGNCLPLAEYPGWYPGTQRRASSWQGRTDGSFRWYERTAHGKGRKVRNVKTSVRRDAYGSVKLPRNHRCDR